MRLMSAIICWIMGTTYSYIREIPDLVYYPVLWSHQPRNWNCSLWVMPTMHAETKAKPMRPQSSRPVQRFTKLLSAPSECSRWRRHPHQETWLFWLQEKPEDPQLEPHASIKMCNILPIEYNSYLLKWQVPVKALVAGGVPPWVKKNKTKQGGSKNWENGVGPLILHVQIKLDMHLKTWILLHFCVGKAAHEIQITTIANYQMNYNVYKFRILWNNFPTNCTLSLFQFLRGMPSF